MFLRGKPAVKRPGAQEMAIDLLAVLRRYPVPETTKIATIVSPSRIHHGKHHGYFWLFTVAGMFDIIIKPDCKIRC